MVSCVLSTIEHRYTTSLSLQPSLIRTSSSSSLSPNLTFSRPPAPSSFPRSLSLPPIFDSPCKPTRIRVSLVSFLSTNVFTSRIPSSQLVLLHHPNLAPSSSSSPSATISNPSSRENAHSSREIGRSTSSHHSSSTHPPRSETVLPSSSYSLSNRRERVRLVGHPLARRDLLGSSGSPTGLWIQGFADQTGVEGEDHSLLHLHSDGRSRSLPDHGS